MSHHMFKRYRSGEYFWEPLFLIIAGILVCYFIISVVRFVATRVDSSSGEVYLSNSPISDRNDKVDSPTNLTPGTVNRPIE